MEELLSIEGMPVAIVKMNGRFFVAYKGSKVELDDDLAVGQGNTIEEACEDYKRIINGKKIILNVGKPDRKEFVIVFTGKNMEADGKMRKSSA